MSSVNPAESEKFAKILGLDRMQLELVAWLAPTASAIFGTLAALTGNPTLMAEIIAGGLISGGTAQALSERLPETSKLGGNSKRE